MSVETDLSRARSLAKRGDVQQARALYRAVLDRFPANQRARDGLRALDGPGRVPAAAPARASSLEDLIREMAQLFGRGHYGEVLARGGPLSVAHPNHPQLANLLGAANAVLGRYPEAIACYARALRAFPDYAEAHHNMANALKATGRQGEAMESYARALQLRPGYAEAHRNLGAMKTFAAGDPQLLDMQRLMGDPGLGEKDRMHLGFALGKAHEDLGEPDAAFALLKEANRLRKKDLGYDPAVDSKLFADIRAVFGSGVSEANAPAPSPARLAKRPIFILGMPRSGTTLVEQILASHSAVHGAGEMSALNVLAGHAMMAIAKSGKLQTSLREAAGAIRSGYDAALAGIGTARPVVTDKMPSNFRWIGFIRLALPEAAIVHVHRDAIATCWSMYKTYFATGGSGYCYDLDDVARYYGLYRGLMRFWHERYPGAIYDLDYEELTQNQGPETRRLLEHCGLDWEPACLDFHKTARAVETASATQVRRQMYTGSSESWRKFERHLQPLVEAIKSIR